MELKYANENIENRRIVERLKFSCKYYCSTLCVIPLVNRNCHGVILNQGNFICNYWKMLYYIHAYGCFLFYSNINLKINSHQRCQLSSALIEIIMETEHAIIAFFIQYVYFL